MKFHDFEVSKICNNNYFLTSYLLTLSLRRSSLLIFAKLYAYVRVVVPVTHPPRKSFGRHKGGNLTHEMCMYR